MRRYIDFAFLWDFLFAITIGAILFFCKPFLKEIFTLPKIENVYSFGISLITVSATLIGFLLTIITVIVTFKNGFDDKSEKKTQKEKEPIGVPIETVFEKKITKETKFYGTEIHKSVVDVFVNSTYEIGIILSVLLIIQFNIISFSVFTISLISTCLFIMILLSIIRSLFIFSLFLKVHLHDKSIDKFKK